MKKHTITIGGRELVFRFDMLAWADIEENVGQLTEMQEVLQGRKRIRGLMNIVAALANAGERAEGREENVTVSWLNKMMHPAQFLDVEAAAMEAITDGMSMESEADDEEEVDLTLREIQKKTGKGD